MQALSPALVILFTLRHVVDRQSDRRIEEPDKRMQERLVTIIVETEKERKGREVLKK